MSREVSDQEILAAKELLKPVMPKSPGTYHCLQDGYRQDVDGNCPHDGLPLRRLPASKT